MKNRSAHLLLSVIAGLLLMTAQTTHAQQSSGNGSRNTSAEGKCHTPVTVTGAVVVPVHVELRRRARLNELLTIAGGLTERASGKVEITRATLGSDCERLTPNDPNKKTESVEVYNLADLLSGNEKANPYLQPGDTINVSEAGVIYVVGSVANPQMLILNIPFTVMTAIEVAGGVRADAVTDRVYIYRSSLDGSDPTRITVNLKAIKNRRADDIILQPYDIVEVLSKNRLPGTPLRLKPNTKVIEKDLPLHIIY